MPTDYFLPRHWQMSQEGRDWEGRDWEGEGSGREGKDWEELGREGKDWEELGREGKEGLLWVHLNSTVSYNHDVD
ncbi:hypothetical protein JCM33374_g284 [Metschnikowia sp. JCM 33374]|nr:hypothetical protein JCM33374_g284 [Metschnikowia sp. JCM 33374]